MSATRQLVSDSRKRRQFELALAICSAYGITPQALEEVASEVNTAMYLAPSNRKQAAGHRVVRRRLAKQLGIPYRQVPDLRITARAIFQYERLRQSCERREELMETHWCAGFDSQSRWFAIENGVCPRCGMAGEFSMQDCRCDCGFSC